MQIKFKNFYIEEYEYGYILRETGIAKEGKNIGSEYDVNTWYPASIERAFLKIRHLTRLSDKENIQIDGLIEKLQDIDEKFISEVKESIKNMEK